MHYLQSRWSEDYLHFAIRIADGLLERFEDPQNGGFFFSDSAVNVPITRNLIFQDDATPAGNAVAIGALSRLGQLIGDHRYTEAAQRCLERARVLVQENPLAFASLLTALNDGVTPRPQVIINGTDAVQQAQLKKWVLSRYRVNCYMIGPGNGLLPGILGEFSADEPVTAWVCHGFKCLPPARSRDILEKQLEE
jgi:uncharacterized protein YyaL (SSP411 family)